MKEQETFCFENLKELSPADARPGKDSAVFEWDFQTGTISSSPAFREYSLSRVPVSSLISHNGLGDVVHPDDRPVLAEFLADMESGEPRCEAILRMRLVLGGYRWCRFVCFRYADGIGKPLKGVGVLVDISEGKGKNDMRGWFLDELPGGTAVFKVGASLECLCHDEGFSRLSDFSKEEIDEAIRRKTLVETLVAPCDLPRVREEARTLAGQGSDVNLTFRILMKNGGLRWIRLNARKLREEGGCPVYYCVCTFPPDASSLYRDIVEASMTGVLVAERKTRRIVFANEALRGFFQAGSGHSVEGKLVFDFLPGGKTILSDREMDALKSDSFTEYHRKLGERFVDIRAKGVTLHGEDCYMLYVSDETAECRKRILQEKLLDLVPAGIGIYELSNGGVRKVYVNEGYYRLVGEPRESRQPKEEKSPLGLVHPDDVPSIRLVSDRILQEGVDSDSVDFRILCDGGLYRWFRLVASVQKREKGTATLYCSFSDIDDAVKGSEALKKTNLAIQKQYAQELAQRKMLEKDSMISVQFNVTSDKLISYRVNQDLVRKFDSGMQGASIRPDIASTIPTEEERRIASDFFDVGKAFSRYQSGIREFSAVYRRRLNDGRLYWLLSICRLAKDEESGDLISYTFLRNIDLERKRELTAESMIDEETDFVMLLNVVSHTALLLRKREGFPHEDWKVGQEFPFDRIPSEKSIDLVDEEDRPAVTGFFHQDNLVGRLREKSVIMQIYRFHHQDGSLRRKKLRAFYLDSIHEDVVIAGRDITDIYQEEQEQKRILQDALDEAKTASRAKSDFLSRMSHDLRTPMNVIIGLTSIAMEDSSESSAETKRLLSDISNSANYLLSLINDCLDIEKITSGKFELHPSVCPYADVFDGIRTVITPLCEKKGIGFVMTGPKDGGPAVLADKMRLKQVFFNLLSNSVKFTPSGGKIEFLVRNNSVSDGRNRFECIVRDDGIGMSEEFQSHMFEPFSQETNSISPESQGSGLGLSIVKQLVDLMGATIHVRSRLGEGTEFTLCFDFPVAKEPARMDAVPMPASRAGLKGKRILLAEDHPLNTMIAVRLLEKEGMKVTTAANGEIALDAFRRSPGHFFDAVLLDIRMPVLNGLETARAIRSLDRSDAKTVPVIAMTANAFDSDVEESLKAGMNAHLSKPIDPEKLYDTLSACMA